MHWYALNKEYIYYLKNFDNTVPNIEYIGRLKCFLGIVLKSNHNIEYFAPLTSYKPKFEKLNNDIDFYKIVGQNHKIHGAININNMIPVPKEQYSVITFDNLPDFREFNNRREQKHYWKLLQTELSYINEDLLLNNAKKLFALVKEKPDSHIAKRCCNFSLLEEKCKQFINTYYNSNL